MKGIAKTFSIFVILLSAFFLFNKDVRAYTFYSDMKTTITMSLKGSRKGDIPIDEANLPEKIIVTDMYNHINYLYSKACKTINGDNSKNGCTVAYRNTIIESSDKVNKIAIITGTNLETSVKTQEIVYENLMKNIPENITDQNFGKFIKYAKNYVGNNAGTGDEIEICNYKNSGPDSDECIAALKTKFDGRLTVENATVKCSDHPDWSIYSNTSSDDPNCYVATMDLVYYLSLANENINTFLESEAWKAIYSQTESNKIEIGETVKFGNESGWFPMEKINAIEEYYQANSNLKQKKSMACAYYAGNTLMTYVDENIKKLDDCKHYFGTTVTYYGLYEIGYDISASKVETPNSAVSFVCSWNQKIDDKDYSLNFQFTVNKEKGTMKYNSASGINNLNSIINFSNKEMEELLSNDPKGILKKFEEEIYSNVSSSWSLGDVLLTIGGVALIIGSVALAPFTGGSTLAIIGVTAAKVIGISIVALETTSHLWDFAVDNIKNAFGDANADAYFYHVNSKEGSVNRENISNVSCVQEEIIPDSDPIEPNIEVNCETIMDGKFGDILKTIMNILRFVACGLLIILSAFDFIKPILSSDSEMLQKSGGLFIKRLIVFILILFIPALVELLLSLINRGSCSIS